MSPLQLAALLALVLRIGFFLTARAWRLPWWMCAIAEVVFLGGIWLWSGQLERPELALGAVALSAVISAASPRMRRAWVAVAVFLLAAQLAVT